MKDPRPTQQNGRLPKATSGGAGVAPVGAGVDGSGREVVVRDRGVEALGWDMAAQDREVAA